jgi:hypothetical protein
MIEMFERVRQHQMTLYIQKAAVVTVLATSRPWAAHHGAAVLGVVSWMMARPPEV